MGGINSHMTLHPLLSFLVEVILSIVVAVPLLLYPFLYFFQENLLFFRQPPNPITQQILQQSFPHSAVTLIQSDQTQLQGWLIHRHPSKPQPLLIYFGGNAEEVSGFMLEMAMILPNWAILSFNYRGYGQSQGRPSEKNLRGDALFIYDWAIQQPFIDSKKIVVMGRSLGTGVAIPLAAQRPVAKVILVSPFDSIRRIAQKIYPYVPIAWLLKHPFDSLSYAPTIQAPMLMLLAEKDTIVPLPHSRQLAEAWGGARTEQIMRGEDHNSITASSHYYPTIRRFLDQDL